MTKKLISIFVAAMMVFSIIPAAVFASEAAREPVPANTKEPIASWDFETDPASSGWTFEDSDGDGYNWTWTAESANSGQKSIMSESYRSGGIYMNPDNWAISPEFVVPDEGAEISFFLRNYLLSYPETFSVYVVPADGEPVVIAADESVATDTWVKLTYDISAHAGETVSMAIRHHNSYNNWKFYIDDIKITLPPSTDVVYEVNVSGFPIRIFGGRPASEMSDMLFIADGVNYELYEANVCDSEGNALAPDALLTVGTAYMLVAELHPVEGMTFDSDALLTANEGQMELCPEWSYVYDGNCAYIAVSYECVEEPAAGWYFEYASADECDWTFVDSDGDGHTWYWLYYGFNANQNMAYEGNGLLTSASYNGNALRPDNWAISPEFEVPAYNARVSMYLGAQDPSYSAEHFAVYVGSGEDVSGYTMVSDEIVATGEYVNYEFDISDYAGETVSIAVRHFNCYDQFRLKLDQVEVFGSSDEPIVELIPITEIHVNGADFPPIAGEYADDHLGLTVPEGANYIIETSPDFYNTPAWYYVNHDELHEQFIEGESYMIACTVKAAEGYRFAEDVTVYINGETALVDMDYSGMGHYDDTEFYVWSMPQVCVAEPPVTEPPVTEPPVEPTVISTVEVFDLTPPALGANPDFDVSVPEGAHYTLTKVEWHDMNKSVIGEDYVITPGYYYVVFEFTPDEGYEFGSVSDTTMLINGSSELVGAQLFCYSFPSLFHMESADFYVSEVTGEVIDSIELLGFVEPAWGEHPFFGVTVPEGANYTIDYTGWTGFSIEGDDGIYMTEDDVFDNPQFAYFQTFNVIPNEGYIFSDDTTVTINGGTEFVYADYCSWVPMENTYYIDTIDFFVTEPASGIPGDADMDGDVDTADALMALRYVMGLIDLTEDQLAQADVDGDGSVTVIDPLLIARKALGLIDGFRFEARE